MAAEKQDAFLRMIDSSFYVPITIGTKDGEEEVKIRCRELPMTTLIYTTTRLFRLASENAVLHGALLSKNIDEVVNAGSDEERRTAASRVFTSFLPILLDVLPSAPDLVERILLDCIIGATPEDIRFLSFANGMAIINEIVQRLEADEVKKHVSGFILAIGRLFQMKKSA